ncbi:MAG: hypothetical protein ACLKAL_09890 [Alkaliphilus sp.]
MHRRIYEGTIRNWLESPIPTIKRGGIVVASDEYVLYAAQGAVVFNAQQAIGAVITADFTHIASTSPLSGHAGSGGTAHPEATPTITGFMSAGDKSRFDNLGFLQIRKAGLYHATITATAMTSSSTLPNAIDFFPFYVPITQTFDRIAINVTTAATGMSRLGLYADTGSVYPGGLLLDAGEVDTGTTGVKAIIITALTLQPGLYWTARNQSHAPSLRSATGSNMMPVGLASDLVSPITGFRVLQTYGVMPNPCPAGATFLTGGRPLVFLRMV